MEIKKATSFTEGLKEYNYYMTTDFLEEDTLLYCTRAPEEDNMFFSKDLEGKAILSSETTNAPVPFSIVCVFSITPFTFSIEAFTANILKILEEAYPAKDLSFGIFNFTDSGEELIDISYEDLDKGKALLHIIVSLSKNFIRVYPSSPDSEGLDSLLFRIVDYIQEILNIV